MDWDEKPVNQPGSVYWAHIDQLVREPTQTLVVILGVCVLELAQGKSFIPIRLVGKVRANHDYHRYEKLVF